MDVGYIFLVSICVLQIAWPAVGLKLSLTNISSKSSPSSTDSTKSSVSAFEPKPTAIDKLELNSNLEKPANRFLQTTSLSSLPVSSPNVIVGDVKETEIIPNNDNTFNRLSLLPISSSPIASSPHFFVDDVKETESRSKVENTFINNVNKLSQTPVSSSFASSANAIGDAKDIVSVENKLNTNVNRFLPISLSRSSASSPNVLLGDVKDTESLSTIGNTFNNNFNRLPQRPFTSSFTPNPIISNNEEKDSESTSNYVKTFNNNFNKSPQTPLSISFTSSPNEIADVKETLSISKVENTLTKSFNKFPLTPLSTAFASSANVIGDMKDIVSVENKLKTNFNGFLPISSLPARDSSNVLLDDVKETESISKHGNTFINNFNKFPQNPSSPSLDSSTNVFIGDVKEIESIPNMGNSFTNFNRFSPISSSALSANVNCNKKNTEDSFLGIGLLDNLQSNNVLSTIQDSLLKQNLKPVSSLLESSNINDPLSLTNVTPKISLFNNYAPNNPNINIAQSSKVQNNNLLSNPDLESNKYVTSTLESLKPNYKLNANEPLLNAINNNFIEKSQVFLDSSDSQPINNHDKNLEESNDRQNTNNLNNIVQDLQNNKNILSNFQNSQAHVSRSLNIQSKTRANNQQPDLSFIKNNIGPGSILPYNLSNNVTPETKSESQLCINNPLKLNTANTQTNLANRIPATNSDVISNFNKNIVFQQTNNNVCDKTVGHNNILDKNLRSKPQSLLDFQNDELQESLAPQNLLPQRVTSGALQNVPMMNRVLGQNSNCVKNQNGLLNDCLNKNYSIKKSIPANNNENAQNSYVESISKFPNNNIPIAECSASVFPNILQDTPNLPELNKLNGISLPVPNTPFISDATIRFNPNIVSPNILQPDTIIYPQQQGVLPPSNIQHSSFHLFNPLVELKSPQFLPESPNINSNLDLTAYPEYLQNLNSISNLASFPNSLTILPQNTNARTFDLATHMKSQSQMPINNNLEFTTPYLDSNCDKYLPFTPYDINNLLHDASLIEKSSIATISDEKTNENILTEPKENILNTSYVIPKISDLPNVVASNYVTQPQAKLHPHISPSNLVVPQIENLIPTNVLTKSLIDLGNDVARQWIDNLLLNAKSAYAPVNPVPFSYSLPNKAENVTPSLVTSPNIVQTQSLPTVPPPEVSITVPVIETIEVDQSNQFTPSSLTTTIVQNDEPQGLFLPRFYPTDVPMFSPSVLPTPTINYPVFQPFMPTPPINFPPVPPLFPPVPAIIGAPIFKMNSGGQDSRKWIELLLLASLLNNDCNDRGPLETIIALMLAT